MEPFEWLILGIGLVIGGLFGANRKGVVKSMAKGYTNVSKKTQEWSANVREDLRDAVEEARYEQELSAHNGELGEEPVHVLEAPRKRRPRATPSATAPATATRTRRPRGTASKNSGRKPASNPKPEGTGENA